MPRTSASHASLARWVADCQDLVTLLVFNYINWDINLPFVAVVSLTSRSDVSMSCPLATQS